MRDFPDDIPRRRWTVAEYRRMADLGFFSPEERLELIDGEIIKVVFPTPLHASLVGWTREVLERTLPMDNRFVRTMNPIVLSEYSQPQPDVVVLTGAIRSYATHHPNPQDVELLIEVSDVTLFFDRALKSQEYAVAGIREYWIINLQDRQIEVHRDPQNGRWATTFTARENESVAPLISPQTPIAVADLLP